MNVKDAIRTLRAVRQFDRRPIEDEVLRVILDAGRRAQSSKNSQPWQFIVIRNRETLRQLSECGQYAGHLAGAAVGVALVSSDKWDFDLGQACAFMMLAAWEQGVGSCIASMWEPEKAKAILAIPAEQHFTTALSLGYPAADWQPAKMGGRHPLEDVVRYERWGEPGSGVRG
jgi:nitroreductase